MGTKIVKAKPVKGEIIPSSAMPKVQEAIVKLEDLQLQVYDLETEIEELVIDTPEKRRRAGEIITALKQAEKDCDTTIDPYNEILKRVREFLKRKTDPVYDEATRLRKALNPRMAEWDDREARAARAEQERLQKEKQAQLEREAEEERQRNAAAAEARRKDAVAQIRKDYAAGVINKRESEKRLRAAGATEEADKAAAAAEAEEAVARAAEVAAKLKVAPAVPNVAGNVRRENRKFTVVDPAKVNAKYRKPDEVAIGICVRQTMKENTDAEVIAEVGGISISYERTY